MRQSGPLRTLLAGVLVALALALFGRTEGADGRPTGADAPAPVPTQITPQPTSSGPTASRTPVRDGSVTSATYAARPRGSRAVVALTVRGGAAIAYICDGARVEAWLRGKVYPEGLLRLQAVKGPGIMTGAIEGDTVTGAATLRGGSLLAFRIPVVRPPSGLYRATGTTTRGARLVGGWIVLPGGDQVGLVNLDGRAEPAPRLEPGASSVVVDGGPVRVAPADPAGP